MLQIVHKTSDGPIVFGPVFKEEFLLTILELQEEIKKITISGDRTLADICFAPLSSPSSETTVSQCTIQSIWGYWQDDVDTFNSTDLDKNNFTVNYLDHFKACTQ